MQSIWVFVTLFTVHVTPPIVTVTSAGTVPKPVPARVTAVEAVLMVAGVTLVRVGVTLLS